jgi:TRAP-type mannitol/chloroaromatic compound transport system substrate-binding protein
MIRRSAVFTLIGVALATTPSAHAQNEPIQWRMNTWVPETSALYRHFALPLVDRVRELTDGRIEITPYPAGVITPSLQAHDAVLDGTADLVQAPPILLYGRDPTSAMFSVWPGGMGPDALMHWMYQGGGKELLAEHRRATLGLHSLPSGMGATELLGHCSKPIRTAEDLEGVKFRTMGAFADVLGQYFGAAPTVVPGSEVYTMLERHAIDCAEWSGPAENLNTGLQETTRYILYPGPQTNAFFMELAMKAETWDALPADLQGKLEAATTLATIDTLLAFDARDIEAWARLKASDNEVIRLSDELVAKFRQAGRDLAFKRAAAEKKNGNPWMERVVQSYYGFYDGWLENADFRAVDVRYD